MNIKVRELEGRPHFVVPMVMIVEGVLNGSHGPIFYPASELERSAHLWNGRPIVVYHPEMLAEPYAGNPEVFNRQKIGTVFNTRFVDRRLKADAWIDMQRAAIVDPRVVRAIEHRKMMEVSTGLVTETEPVAGEFMGVQYDGVARHYRPDHLAVLPDQIGACSVAAGAGLIRNEINLLEPLVSAT